MFFFKQSTASQKARVLLVDDGDGKTPETGVTSPTIKIAKNNASFGDPSDGAWAEQAHGWYTVQLDASDTETLGPLQIHVEKTGCRNFDDHGHVVAANVVDSLFGTDKIEVNVAEISDDATAADNLESYCDGTDRMPVDVREISEDETAADNLESYCDGTTPQPVNATHLEGAELGAKAGDNFDAFFHNAGDDSAKTVDDVGGNAEWSDAEKQQLRKALGLSGESAETTGTGNLDAALSRLGALVGLPVLANAALTGTEQDIARYRGDTTPVTFGLGRDITGATLAFTVKRRATDPQSAALIAKTSAQSSEIEITDASAGQFLVKLAADDTAGLLPDGRRATFLYDVEMTLGGAIETVAAGDFILHPDVTTP